MMKRSVIFYVFDMISILLLLLVCGCATLLGESTNVGDVSNDNTGCNLEETNEAKFARLVRERGQQSGRFDRSYYCSNALAFKIMKELYISGTPSCPPPNDTIASRFSKKETRHALHCGDNNPLDSLYGSGRFWAIYQDFVFSYEAVMRNSGYDSTNKDVDKNSAESLKVSMCMMIDNIEKEKSKDDAAPFQKYFSQRFGDFCDRKDIALRKAGIDVSIFIPFRKLVDNLRVCSNSKDTIPDLEFALDSLGVKSPKEIMRISEEVRKKFGITNISIDHHTGCVIYNSGESNREFINRTRRIVWENFLSNLTDVDKITVLIDEIKKLHEIKREASRPLTTMLARALLEKEDLTITLVPNLESLLDLYKPDEFQELFKIKTIRKMYDQMIALVLKKAECSKNNEKNNEEIKRLDSEIKKLREQASPAKVASGKLSQQKYKNLGENINQMEESKARIGAKIEACRPLLALNLNKNDDEEDDAEEKKNEPDEESDEDEEDDEGDEENFQSRVNSMLAKRDLWLSAEVNAFLDDFSKSSNSCEEMFKSVLENQKFNDESMKSCMEKIALLNEYIKIKNEKVLKLYDEDVNYFIKSLEMTTMYISEDHRKKIHKFLMAQKELSPTSEKRIQAFLVKKEGDKRKKKDQEEQEYRQKMIEAKPYILLAEKLLEDEFYCVEHNQLVNAEWFYKTSQGWIMKFDCRRVGDRYTTLFKCEAITAKGKVFCSTISWIGE